LSEGKRIRSDRLGINGLVPDDYLIIRLKTIILPQG